MIDYKKRKKSEQWVKEKANEFIMSEADCSLTFAEWCYLQGKADGRTEALDDIAEDFNEHLFDSPMMNPIMTRNEILLFLNELKERTNEQNIR